MPLLCGRSCLSELSAVVGSEALHRVPRAAQRGLDPASGAGGTLGGRKGLCGGCFCLRAALPSCVWRGHGQ